MNDAPLRESSQGKQNDKTAAPGTEDRHTLPSASPGMLPGTWEDKELTYQLATEAAGIGTWEQDLSSGSMTICAIMAQMLSLPAQQTTLSSKEWRDMIVPEDLPVIDDTIALYSHTGQTFNLEYRLKPPAGSMVWIFMRGKPVGDERGRMTRMVGVAMNVTQKKEVEERAFATEERYRQLTELSPDGILVSANGLFVYANQAAINILGAPDILELNGRSPFEFFHPESHEVVKAQLASALDGAPTTTSVTLRLRRMDGSTAYVQTTAAEVNWNGKPSIQVLIRDVTEQKHTEDKLRIANERLKLAVEGTVEGIWDWEIPENVFTFSGGLNKVLGFAEDSSYGVVAEWQHLVHPDDVERMLASFKTVLEEQKGNYECEYRLKAKDGSWKWVWSRGVVIDRDAHGAPLVMTGTLTDITGKKQSDELVWRHANLDALTGLPNRRMFRDRLDAEVRKASRNGTQLALLFIDLDGFKQVNDLFGHDAGDLLLMEASYRITNCVRETDIAARLGGDEFTIVLTDLDDPNHVEFVCQKILSKLTQPFRIRNDFAYVTGSIGVTIYPYDGEGSEELIRKADQAMYAAKGAGKNQFSYFTREMDEKAHARLHLSNELRHALPSGQLSLHYQPVIDLTEGCVVKAEALLRWQHPTLGNVGPATFIPLAEESGLIGAIGNWAFQQAAECSKRFSRQTGKLFPIGINKSPVQFMHHDRDSNWLEYLEQQDIPANSIMVEITEGLLLNPTQVVNNQLLQYRDAGITVAIDDFGTGYSSLSYLHHFDIDFLKIDQSFVQDLSINASHRAIAETMIMMAHKLGLKVIAEGIETREQMEFLADAGCDYGQGYFFSRPVPEDQLEKLLSTRFLM
jgi:diguanylate cyclase (GGDEF)-like protein/PAS domain S-box-containing protein